MRLAENQGTGTQGTTIPEFQFSKLWTNAADFPTVEMNETQVREDMQRLHNETRDYINTYLRGKMWFGTQAQYDAIETKDSMTLYFIEEAAT